MPEIQKDNFSTENRARSSLKTKRLLVGVHIHQFAELAYIIDGEVTVIRNNKIKEIARAGDVVAILPYQEHGYFVEENKKIKYWMALFSESLMSDIAYHESSSLEYKSLVFKPSAELKALIEAKMFDTGDKIIEPDFETTLSMKSLIYATFSEYFKKRPSDTQKEAVSQNQIASSDPVIKAISYLRANFRDEVSIEDCAKKIGYSASHISHCLKKNFHMTFLQLRNDIRVNYAKHLLRFKRMSIYEVALECGFTNEQTFKRVFKQRTKLTPHQFKKNNFHKRKK
ncbi:MAG: helix-turn-helix transcriptional regulator [Clostridia bacterium]|nr:helix-turn-helix transcriptional regulator [Clostridia bacterium]